MEELKTLKELFDAGFMPQAEYEKRRIDIVNRITGSSYGPGGAPAAAAVPAAAPAAAAPTPAPVQAQPAAVPAAVPAPAAAPLDDTAVLLGELSLDDDALWDELDALANVGPSQPAAAAPSLQPTGSFPAATLRPSQAAANMAAGGLQPTAQFQGAGASATLRQPAAVGQTATLRQPANIVQSATLRQPANIGQTATLRQPQQAQAATLRQPAQLQSTMAYGQQQQTAQQPQPQPMLQQPLAMQAMGMQEAAPAAAPAARASASGAVPRNSAPSEYRGAPSLQSHAMAARSSSKTAMMDMVGGGKGAASSGKGTPYTWEFFHAAQNNNVKKLSDLIDLGVDVNQRDTDTSNTALHLAAMRGQKHAIYFLIDQGADIDAQNRKGSTPLHLLVNNRFNNLAVWMVKQGADINIEDIRGFTPYDMALPWLQKEMKEAMYGRTRTARTQQQINRVFGELSTELNPEVVKEAQFQKAQQMGISLDTLRGQGQPQQAAAQPASTPLVQDELDMMMGMAASGGGGGRASGGGGQDEEQEVMKIYLKNGAYKSLLIKSSTKVGDVCAMMAGKLNLEEHSNSFDLLDVQRDKSRRLDPTANVLKLKGQWPLILGKKGNETEKYCKFVVVPKRGTSEAVQKLYRRAMHK